MCQTGTASTSLPRWIWPGYALLLAGCLFISLKTVFGMVGTDSDSILAITLWQGVQAHGLGWIAQFRFTPDNWLLSIVPFNFLSFALFGAQAWLVALSGWAVFAGAALFAALLAREMGALALPIPLLLLGSYAQMPGFVAYPASHDVTNLYGLAALFGAVRALRGGGNGYLALVGCLLAAGSVSDPWMVTAYDLPLLACCVAGGWRPGERAVRLRWLAGLALLAAVLAHTRLIWLLGFVPRPSARPAPLGVMVQNALYLVKDLGGLLNIVPGGAANALRPALLSLAGVGLAAGMAWRGAVGAGLLRQGAVRLVLGVALLSALLTMAGFVVLNTRQGDFSGRYLINILYFLAIFLAVAVERGWALLRWPGRAVVVLYPALFLACGLAGTAPVWRQPGLTLQTNGVMQIAGFLQANGLAYGYGPYHGAQANAVTAMTDGRIIIRPVTFDPSSGQIQTRQQHGQTTPSWYTPVDVPPGQRTFFVYIVPDGEECPDPALCVAGLTAQFGTPDRQLRNGVADILVWDHPLLASR